MSHPLLTTKWLILPSPDSDCSLGSKFANVTPGGSIKTLCGSEERGRNLVIKFSPIDKL